MKKMKNGNRDSLARKSHFNQLCGGYQAKFSGGQFITQPYKQLNGVIPALVAMSNIAVRCHCFCGGQV